MKKKFIFIPFLLASLSLQLYGRSGLYIGGNVGFLGHSTMTNISVNYDNGSAVAGTATTDTSFGNALGFKAQIGYKYDFQEKYSLIFAFGHANKTTEKVNGIRGDIDSTDISGLAQFRVMEGWFVRVGVNYPISARYSPTHDDRTRNGIQGGTLDAKGLLGYDVSFDYYLMTGFAVSLGYSLTNLEVLEERTNGTEYTVKFDATHGQFVFGLDYTVPLGFL